jgi:hypothetical protein
VRPAFRNEAPSHDVVGTNYYGGDATVGWNAGDWTWYASAGIVRTRLTVQVDALVFTSNDRSRLTSNGNLPWVTLGVRHDLPSRWGIAAELLYVPLEVRRPPDFSFDRDPVTGVRMQLRYTTR